MRLIPALAVLFIIVAGCTTQQVQTDVSQSQSPAELEKSGDAVSASQQAQEEPAPLKEFNMTAKQFEFIPNKIEVNKGDNVRLNIKSIDVAHGFGLPEFNINERLEPGREVSVEFVADKEGTYTFFCTVYCGTGHAGMKGTLIVK